MTMPASPLPRISLLPLFLWLLFVASAPVLAFEAPAFQGDILDEAGILTPADQDALRQRIAALRENNGIWAAVYVCRNLQGESIEGVAVTVFEKWKLGQAGKDNGLLVVIAPAEHKMRIEVGYGLEGNITDALSKRIVDEIYKPAFRERHYEDGLMQGFTAMARAAGGEMPANLPKREDPPTDTTQRVNLDFATAGTWFAIAFVANLLPLIPIRRTLLARQNQKTRHTRRQDLWPAVAVFTFLGLFFGLFFAVFTASVGIAALVPLALFNLLFAGVFSLPFLLKGGSNRRGTGTTWDDTTLSWSDSSSDSDSSSSGGGSSGGGGASGNW